MPKNALAPPSVNALQPAPDVPRNALARLYSAYQQYVGQPFAQTVRGGVRGYFGLPLMSDADATGREAYRQGEALGFTPGVGAPAGAVRVAAEGVQALPSIAGDIGRVIAGMPRGAARAQAEDFARYQRSIPPSDVSPLTAFHGTPHTFEPTAANPLGEFRAAKIGSGEGAQAFGYGTYFAESPGVARHYRTAGNAAFPIVSVNGKQPTDLLDYIPDAGDLYDVIGKEYGAISGKKAKELALRFAPENIKQKYQNVPDSAFTVSRNEGNLYTVDIPDSIVEKMLDWDKPLSQQAESVQRALGNLPADVRSHIGIGKYDNLKGGVDIFQPLGGLLGDRRASEILRQAGIPGIRYLDQSSRAVGEGTRNIVVFPGEESKVKILKRD